MARIDKYQPVAGGFRAPLNANLTGGAAPLGVGLNSSGRVVVGAGQTGVVGVIVSPYDKKAGDIIDVMTNGELVEFGGAAGTVYTANTTTGVISNGAASGAQIRVGHTVEADRLVVRMGAAALLGTNVVGDQAEVVELTPDTAQAALTAADELTDIPAVDAASGEATAAALDDTNTSFAAVNQAIADLAAKVNEVIGILAASGLTTSS